MARSSSNLASVEPTEEAPFGYKADGTPRKRASREGEKRKQRPIRMVFNASDASGQPVQGATIEVLYAGKDTEAYTDACDANPTASRAKINLTETE